MGVNSRTAFYLGLENQILVVVDLLTRTMSMQLGQPQPGLFNRSLAPEDDSG